MRVLLMRCCHTQAQLTSPKKSSSSPFGSVAESRRRTGSYYPWPRTSSTFWSPRTGAPRTSKTFRFDLPVVVLTAKSNRLDDLEPLMDEVWRLLEELGQNR